MALNHIFEVKNESCVVRVRIRTLKHEGTESIQWALTVEMRRINKTPHHVFFDESGWTRATRFWSSVWSLPVALRVVIWRVRWSTTIADFSSYAYNLLRLSAADEILRKADNGRWNIGGDEWLHKSQMTWFGWSALWIHSKFVWSPHDRRLL